MLKYEEHQGFVYYTEKNRYFLEPLKNEDIIVILKDNYFGLSEEEISNYNKSPMEVINWFYYVDNREEKVIFEEYQNAKFYIEEYEGANK